MHSLYRFKTNILAQVNPMCIPRRTITSYFFRTVRYFFKEQLLFTNTITSGLFLGLGDLIQQEMEFRRNPSDSSHKGDTQGEIFPKSYDWFRAGRMFIVGFFMGPLHHYYYINLDKLLPRADLKTAFKKVLADQTIASPLTLLYFFYAMGLLEGKSIKECNHEIETKLKYVYLGDCMFWPPIQLVNFTYVRTEYRVFYINLATLFFDIFLSYMKFDF